MTELGVMVYPDLSPMSEIKEYLRRASKFGFNRVTSSMLSVEGTDEEIVAYFTELNRVAHTFGMKVSLDVNTNFLKRFHQSYDNLSLFHEIQCDILRLDGSYGAELDYIMTQNPYGIQIEMNATSSRVESEIAFFHGRNVSPDRVQLCHNAYPQRYTGLKWTDFLEKNHSLKRYGYKIAAIISSQAPHTHGIWGAEDGLPTVERLRDLPIDLQARIILATDKVDDLLIGNAYATEAELQALAEVIRPPRSFEDSPIYAEMKAYGPILPNFGPCRRLKVIPEKDMTRIERENLFDLIPQMDNGDSSEWIWRSRCGRLINKNRPIPPRPYAKEMFPVGSVVIVNDANRHYSGEIQIVRRPIINDGKRNYIARLAPFEDQMLEMIQDGDIVEFLEYTEN